MKKKGIESGTQNNVLTDTALSKNVGVTLFILTRSPFSIPDHFTTMIIKDIDSFATFINAFNPMEVFRRSVLLVFIKKTLFFQDSGSSEGKGTSLGN
jgi:hypothetical protein